MKYIYGGIVLIVGLLGVVVFIIMQPTKENMPMDENAQLRSIPESEILSGGPAKDGIPSIDNPQFVSAKETTFITPDEFGIGLAVGNETKFYPFKILVWHEIVNDSIAGVPVAVTYCPLCRTGVVYKRTVEGREVEFGVSGKLWKSNLLMYNRGEKESLWSQVLGEAVVGPYTGQKLEIVSSDTVTFGNWKKEHPNTLVLSEDTGVSRPYGRDPYGDYYTSEEVSFGAEFNDTRLHPKAYVVGIHIGDVYKAYPTDTLPTGETKDTVGGKDIIINKTNSGEIRITSNNNEVKHIGGFWFSWLAVHPNTLLWEK